MSRSVRISIGCVMAALALPALAAAPASAAGTSNPYVYWHRTYQASLRYDNAVVSVAAASQHDFWAIDQGGRAGLASVLRWNGLRWRAISVPGHFEAEVVTAAAPHDVWLTGRASGTLLRPEALRWDGSHWHKISMPFPQDSSQPMVVLGPRNAWVAGRSSWTRSAGWRSLVWHWNGARWRRYSLPVDTIFTGTSIVGMAGHGVWLFGEVTRSQTQTPHGTLAAYRWSGSRWLRADVPARRISEPPQPAMARSGEIWLVTAAARLSQGRYPSELLRRSGGRWHQLSTGGLGLGQPGPDGLGDAWFSPSIYYTGIGVSWLTGIFSEIGHCAGGMTPTSNIAGIPGSHSVLVGGWCMPHTTGRYQGLIMISKPQ